MYDQGQRKIIPEIHAQKFVCLLNPVINCFWGYSAPLLNIRLFSQAYHQDHIANFAPWPGIGLGVFHVKSVQERGGSEAEGGADEVD